MEQQSLETKRHLLTTEKQYLGQYFTTNADNILLGWEHLVKDKEIIDPFAGGKDLINWAMHNGAQKYYAYDIEPKSSDIIQNDSLMTPPSYEGKFVISNPPYLASNKCRNGDKRPYKKWDQSDYYKCHMASLYPTCEEGILIVPSNFLSESNRKAREMFLFNYNIIDCKYWNEPVFDDATTGITAFHFKKKDVSSHSKQTFSCVLLPENKSFQMELEKKYGYLFGKEFFDHIDVSMYNINAATIGDDCPNTNIIIGFLDNGKYKTGFHYNDGECLYVKPTVITTYQVNVEGVCLSVNEQKEVIRVANDILNRYRAKYHSMFLSNYLGANQKILSQSYAKKILSKSIDIVLDRISIL